MGRRRSKSPSDFADCRQPLSPVSPLFALLASKAMKTARGICVSRMVLAKRYGQRGERPVSPLVSVFGCLFCLPLFMFAVVSINLYHRCLPLFSLSPVSPLVYVVYVYTFLRLPFANEYHCLLLIHIIVY